MLRFGDLDKRFCTYSNSKIVVLPIPFDKTSTWLKGSDKGPSAIIEASPNLEMYDIDTSSNVGEIGIYTAQPVTANNSKEMITKVYKMTKKFLNDDKFVVGLGGEHSVSIGLVMAHTEKFENLSVVQLDAHLDLRDTYLGDKFNHACVMTRIKEIISNAVQVGIRTADEEELQVANFSKVFLAKDIISKSNWHKKAIDLLSNNVYVTIDLDVFDPSLMPSVSTPEPGGLGWYDVMNFLSSLTKKKSVVGFDVVELCPIKGLHAPNFTAAKVVYSFLNLIFEYGKK